MADSTTDSPISINAPKRVLKSVASRLPVRVQHSFKNAQKRFFDMESLVEAEQTPFNVVWEKNDFRVRYYPPLRGRNIYVCGDEVAIEKDHHKTPLVIVAPLAVNMFIYDLFEDRSFVKFMRAKGFEVYLIDWGRPGSKHNHFDLSTYYGEWLPTMLDQVRAHSGKQQLSLHGWSFGGLFSYAAAVKDQDIKNLVLIGAPCDYHNNGDLGKQVQRIGAQAKWIRKRFNKRIHDAPKRYLRSPGWMNSLSFKLTNPVGTIQGYLELFKNIHDDDFVRSHTTNAAFIDDMVAYPGAVIQDVIHYLWTENVLAKGWLPEKNAPEKGRTLDKIQANIFALYGKDDPIVTEQGSKKLLDFISATDVTKVTVPGGHMGIVGASSAPKNSWYAIADWLAQRD